MVINLLCGCSFWLFLGIAAVKSVHAARRVDQLLLASEERMARRTNFHVQIVLLGRARLETFATGAGDRYLFVFWMNSGFHFFATLDSYRQIAPNKQLIIRAEVRIVKPSSARTYVPPLRCFYTTLRLVVSKTC